MHLLTGAGTTEHTYEEQEEAAGAHTHERSVWTHVLGLLFVVAVPREDN